MKQDLSTIQDSSVHFLLTEYLRFHELWQQTDSRVGTYLNLLLTFIGLSLSGLVLIAANFSVDIFLFASIFVSTSIACALTLITTYMHKASVIKSEYIYAIDLIRDYFVLENPRIAVSLLFFAKSDKLLSPNPLHLFNFPQSFTIFVILSDSLLFSYSTAIFLMMVGNLHLVAILAYYLVFLPLYFLIFWLILSISRKSLVRRFERTIKAHQRIYR